MKRKRPVASEISHPKSGAYSLRAVVGLELAYLCSSVHAGDMSVGSDFTVVSSGGSNVAFQSELNVFYDAANTFVGLGVRLAYLSTKARLKSFSSSLDLMQWTLATSCM